MKKPKKDKETEKDKCNCRYCQNRKQIESQKWAKFFRKTFRMKIGKGKGSFYSYPAYTEEILLFIWDLLKKSAKN